MVREFIPVETDLDTIDSQGRPKRIQRVPALKDKASEKVWIDPEAAARAELQQLAESVGVEPRHVPLLVLFYARMGNFQRGYQHNKYKLNKMLFYQWKELEKIGLGEAYEHDEFIKATRGPIPKNLYDDLEELEKNGILVLSGGKEEHKTLVAQLTGPGKEVARRLFNEAPPDYATVATRVKTAPFPLNPDTIMKRVHRDYPEYRKSFTEPDQE